MSRFLHLLNMRENRRAHRFVRLGRDGMRARKIVEDLFFSGQRIVGRINAGRRASCVDESDGENASGVRAGGKIHRSQREQACWVLSEADQWPRPQRRSV